MKEQNLIEEIERLKRLPQDKYYKGMCVFDEVRKLKAELKGRQEVTKDVKEAVKKLKDVYRLADKDVKDNLYAWIDEIFGDKLVEK